MENEILNVDVTEIQKEIIVPNEEEHSVTESSKLELTREENENKGLEFIGDEPIVLDNKDSQYVENVIKETAKNVNTENKTNSEIKNITNVSPFEYKETTEQDLKDIINKIKLPLALPSGKILDIFTLIAYLARNKNKVQNILTNLSQEQRILLSDQDQTLSMVSKEFMKDVDNNELDFSNVIKYGEVDTGIQSVKNNEIDPNNKTANVGRFLSIIGLGNNIDIPLYHSGFRITCKAPTQTDFSKLELDIYNAELNLGRETSGFITSNRKGFAMDIIATLITNCIISTTLKLNEDDDILKYISILDFNIILLSLIQASNPNKIDIQRPCSNLYTINDERVVCGEFVTGVVNPSKLLFVNNKVIDETMLSIIARKSEGSVSIEDRELYLSLLKKNTKKYQTVAGVNIEDHYDIYPISGQKDNYIRVNFFIPSIYQYLESSTIWLNNIKAEIEDILDADNDNARKDIVAKIINNNHLSILSSNIENLYVNISGEYYTNPSEIIQCINSINYGNETFSEINDHIQNFVATSMFAICAIPNYTCPKCKKLQEQDETINDEFKSFIPLDMTDFFFKLIQHRNEKMAQNNTL